MSFLQQIADNQEYVTFNIPDEWDRFRITARHVKADVQPGALLTVHASFDGVAFNTGSVYHNSGWSWWPGEPNPSFHPVPFPLGYPQTLQLGCRIGIDVGERPDKGLDVDADFNNFGTLNGNPVSPQYRAFGNVGFIGGVAGVSARPAFLGGGQWFDQDATAPFDWDAQFCFSGHINVSGQKIKAVRFSMDGGGAFDRNIEHGYFAVAQVLPVWASPPTPGVTFTVIGNANNAAAAIAGSTSKPAGSGAWKASATSLWIGKQGSAPWTAPQIQIVGSNNDGFVFGHPPTPFAGMTAKLYESDSVPANETDGTLVDTKTMTDTDASPTLTLTPSNTAKLCRWVVLSHNQAATSMYVSYVG